MPQQDGDKPEGGDRSRYSPNAECLCYKNMFAQYV